jgi:dTDP-4-amino-4,6-dideoxygalactose transaminase
MLPDRSYWHERVGYNYRITNLQAAIGHSQLWRINEVLQRIGDAAIGLDAKPTEREGRQQEASGTSGPPYGTGRATEPR